jgi:hypothetical protein
MDNMSNKFGLPQSLLDAVKNIQREETEYQMKVKALMKKKGITSLGQLSPDEKKAFFNQLDSMHQAKNEETELEESDLPSTKEKQKTVMVVHKTSGKELKIQASALDKYKAMGYKLMEETEIEEGKSGTGYELYHKDFSSAMQHAYDFAKKKYNIEIDPFEIDRNVAMGPKKPSSGKANAYRLLDKTGKKAIQVQVTNLDNKRYELNMYKEDLDLEESGGPVVYKKGDDHIEKYGDEKFAVYKNGKKTKYYKSMDDAKAALEEAKDEGASKKKETEFHSKLDKIVHKTFGKRPEEMKEQEKDLPFTPDKPKKNPGVVPGKHGVGASIAKHLAKMAMKKQQEKKPVKEDVEEACWDTHKQVGMKEKGGKMVPNCVPKNEASSSAQQAAIAIAMKKAGKTPKEEGVMIPGKMKSQARKVVGSIMSEEDVEEGIQQTLRKYVPGYAKRQIDKKMDAEKFGRRDVDRDANYWRYKKVQDKLKKEEVEEIAEASDTSINNQSKRAAISMQMAQLKMKHQKEREALMKKKQALSDEVEFQFDESFTPQMLDTLRKQYSTINAIDPASDGYKKLIKMLDGLSDQNLKSLAGSKIKFVSGLAQNRVRSRGIKEEQIDEYDSKGGVYRHKGTYGSAKGSEYGDTDYDQENKMQKTLDKVKSAVKKGANQNRRTDTKLYKEEDGSATKDKDQVKNSKKQVIKKGDTLSGKKETIIIEPELKDK